MIRSMRSKVFLAIISITFLTASAITLIFYLKSTQMIEDNYGTNLYGRIEQVGNAFDDAMKEIYYITVQASNAEGLSRQAESLSENRGCRTAGEDVRYAGRIQETKQ